MSLTVIASVVRNSEQGEPETVTLTGSPHDIQNGEYDHCVRVFLNGGVGHSIAYKQNCWESSFHTLGTVPPFMDLQPGDTMRITYVALTPPAVKWCPI